MKKPPTDVEFGGSCPLIDYGARFLCYMEVEQLPGMKKRGHSLPLLEKNLHVSLLWS